MINWLIRLSTVSKLYLVCKNVSYCADQLDLCKLHILEIVVIQNYCMDLPLKYFVNYMQRMTSMTCMTCINIMICRTWVTYMACNWRPARIILKALFHTFSSLYLGSRASDLLSIYVYRLYHRHKGRLFNCIAQKDGLASYRKCMMKRRVPARKPLKDIRKPPYCAESGSSIEYYPKLKTKDHWINNSLVNLHFIMII